MIYVVSGLSRSGTSVMMKILIDIGIDPYFDSDREAYLKSIYSKRVTDNQYFYEDKNVIGGIINDYESIDGKCIKVMSLNLRELDSEKIKVIYMCRDHNRRKKSLIKLEGIDLERHTEEDEAINQQYAAENFDVIFIDYDELIDDKENQLNKIKDFLNIDFDVNEISKLIDFRMRHFYPGVD